MKTTKQGTPYSITKKGMAYIYEIEGKGFGGYALTHVSKRKLSESEIDEIGSGNEYKNGGGVGNYKKFGKDNSRLVNFDIDNLDDFESMQYDHLINSMDKASALQILINNVEGDYSQLSKELSEIAEEQYPSNDLYEDNREYAKGGKLKRSKESIIADSRYKALPEGLRKSKKYAIIELADGTKIRRRNANQTGDVEGGRYYSEKRPSHTDKEGKAVVSIRKKAIKKSVSVSKPSDSIKFVGISFKRYNYTVGGL